MTGTRLRMRARVIPGPGSGRPDLQVGRAGIGARMIRGTPDLKVGPTRVSVLLVLLLAIAAPAAAQAVHLAVIVGLSGTAEHAELFRRWAGTLVDGASGRGVTRDHIIYLSELPEQDAKRATGKSTKEDIEKAFAAMAKSAAEDDIVMVVLIGHGAFDGKIAKFNLPGPDMTPGDFNGLLAKLPSRHVAFINTASSSGPFLAELAGPGRTIITATRSGAERFSTLFGGHFIDALFSDAADADKNRRVSLLEAFNAARLETTRSYEREGIMLTEHPLLDDSGDRQGSATPSVDGKNGRIAGILSLGTAAAGEALPDDPKLRALVLERRDLERRVEGLKLLKTSMDPARYASELEKLLTELAVKGKQIRDLGGKE